MQVTNIRVTGAGLLHGCVRVSADVSYGDRPNESETYWYEVPASLGSDLGRSGNAWLVALLPLACTIGEPLEIDAPVDAVLVENVYELMDAWRFWYPAMRPVAIHAERSLTHFDSPPTRTGQFFSGGIDSHFTTLRHVHPDDPVQIDDLLFCWGFDVPLSETDAMARLRSSFGQEAAELGKRLVVIATNLRETRFGQLAWAKLSHGCAMSSAGLLLERTYGRLLIPSTDGYRETGPYGSHALTDHLFSTSTTRVVHDGSRYSRLEKVELVSRSPVALAHLRVCWRSWSDHNCGECEKCLRTMIALDLCGALSDAPTFAHARLDLERVARIYCPEEKIGSLRLYYEELLARARLIGRRDLASALERALARSRRREFLLDGVRALRTVPFFWRLANSCERWFRAPLVT